VGLDLHDGDVSRIGPAGPALLHDDHRAFEVVLVLADQLGIARVEIDVVQVVVLRGLADGRIDDGRELDAGADRLSQLLNPLALPS
jgi:hypothetical protein